MTKIFLKIFISAAVSVIALLLLLGCGKEPTAPITIEMGQLEIHAMYDTTVNGVDTVWEASTFIYDIDDSTIYDTSFTGSVVLTLTPGIHNIYVESGEYSTTKTDTIVSGELKVTNPKMTLLAPLFTLKGLHYDTTQPDSILYTPEINLNDFRRQYSVTGADSIPGEVVLLFYFEAP